jgi:hypothetical protein
MRRLVCVTVLAGLTLSCSSPGSKRKASMVDTPSGQPEIVIQSARLEPIQAAAREFFAGRGYTESASRHAYELVFDRRIEDSKKLQALRVRLRAAPIDPTSWRLAGISLRVEDWRGDLASESVVPYGFAQVQEFLEAIKLQVEFAK